MGLPITENRQRIGLFAFVPSLLSRFGLVPAEVLASVGLPPDALNNPEGTIAYRSAGMLLKVAAEKTNCPHFGLELGKLIRASSLGLIGELMRNAPNLREGLRDFAANHHRNSHGSVVYLLEVENAAYFGYAVYEPDTPGNQVISDVAALAGLNFVCEILGTHQRTDLEVLLSRRQPQNLAPYHEAFGVKVRFNAEQTAVVMPRSWLDKPVPGADPVRRLALRKRVRSFWGAGGLDIVTQVRRAIRISLVQGHVSAVMVASELGLGRRTLQRRLDEAGVGFQEVLDQTRCEYAKQMLTNTRLGIAEIANIVGFKDHSILTRSFTRWAGVTPSGWRAHPLT
jgi:AraC-like DNA-binding protein